MASGKTLDLIKFSKRYVTKGHSRRSFWVRGELVTARDKEPRDRSLNGKARIKARRQRHRAGW